MSKDVKLNYEDVSLVPSRITTIDSRQECFPYHLIDGGFSLPIFTAPMDMVVDRNTMDIYGSHTIIPILPRTESIDCRINALMEYMGDSKPYFVAFSLQETKNIFLEDETTSLIDALRYRLSKNDDQSCHICIDLANGHMKSLINAIKTIKDKYGSKVIIMSGNIANPKTYEDYDKAGCDYVRCNIGSGSRCTTASNVSVFYAPFSLIKETWEVKQKIGGACKIIADGGIKGFRDIQKALVYADFVMIGSLFNKSIDSAGTPVYGRFYWDIWGKKVLNPFKTFFKYGKSVKVEDYEKVLKSIKEGKVEVWKEYYGMSTKKAQSKINPNAKLKTGEGIVRRQKVEYSLKQWVNNEVDYLRSAMSYTNSRTLEEYQDSDWIKVNSRAYND